MNEERRQAGAIFLWVGLTIIGWYTHGGIGVGVVLAVMGLAMIVAAYTEE